MTLCIVLVFFFFNDTATTEIYTLSLHDALPISVESTGCLANLSRSSTTIRSAVFLPIPLILSSTRELPWMRSEEHTSELQSRQYLVCRLLLEKKKQIHTC